MNILQALTIETQICICLVLVLCIILASGYIAWHMGWNRCADYIKSLNMKHMNRVLDEMKAEDLMLEQGREADHERRDM